MSTLDLGVCMCVYSSDNPQVGPNRFRIGEEKWQYIITALVHYPVGAVHRAQNGRSLLKDRQLASDRAMP